jgi:hypothetical protein
MGYVLATTPPAAGPPSGGGADGGGLQKLRGVHFALRRDSVGPNPASRALRFRGWS